MALSAVIISKNEEHNLARTLASVVDLADEIILLDSGSTDRTLEIARGFGPKVKIYEEEWKGFARQKNSAIAKATSEWILSLDADEEVSPELKQEIESIIRAVVAPAQNAASQIIDGGGPNCGVIVRHDAYSIPRKNFFLNRWIRHGGFYPDRKVRLVKRELAVFEDRIVHEDIKVAGVVSQLQGALLHHAYPSLAGYLDHMNRYSTLGAEMAVARGTRGFSFFNIALRPWSTFLYNYVFRAGFLDGREGLLLHLYHAVYVSWKYAKIWELSRHPRQTLSS